MAELEINIFGEDEFRDREAENLIEKAAKAVWARFQYDFDASVDITLTDNEGIREINREYREIDSSTDVLSFPMNEFSEGEEPEDLSFSQDPDTGIIPLGDMIISVEKARSQGEEFGHGFERECAYLTVHSMLHLLGFDHMDEGEMKARMRAEEENIMKSIGLERE